MRTPGPNSNHRRTFNELWPGSTNELHTKVVWNATLFISTVVTLKLKKIYCTPFLHEARHPHTNTKHHSWTHQEHIQISISASGRKWLTSETTHFTQQLVPLLASTAIQRVAISRFQLSTDSLISWPTADFKPLFSWQSCLLPGGSVCSTGNWKQIAGVWEGGVRTLPRLQKNAIRRKLVLYSSVSSYTCTLLIIERRDNTKWTTTCVEMRRYWEANSSSESLKNFLSFFKIEGSLHCSQQHTTNFNRGRNEFYIVLCNKWRPYRRSLLLISEPWVQSRVTPWLRSVVEEVAMEQVFFQAPSVLRLN